MKLTKMRERWGKTTPKYANLGWIQSHIGDAHLQA